MDQLQAVTGPTEAQLRALHRGFNALGYTRRSDRSERLAAAAAALDLSQLDSFSNLTRGQAGALLGCLRRAGLLTPDQPHPAAPVRQPVPPACTSTALSEVGTSETLGRECADPGWLPDIVFAAVAAAAAITAGRTLYEHWRVLADQRAYRSTTTTRPSPKNARAAA